MIGYEITHESVMPSMLIRRSNLFFYALCTFLFASKFCYASELSRITIDAYKHPAQVKYQEENLILDRKLKKDWGQIDQGFSVTAKPFLIDDSKLLWFVIKKPSKPNSFGRGLCGAGTEDYFYLVKMQRATLSYVDKFFARGCLAFTEIGYGAELDEKLEGITVDHATLIFEQHKTDMVTDKKTRTKFSLRPTKNQILIESQELPLD